MDPKGYFSSIGLLDRLFVKWMGHQESTTKTAPTEHGTEIPVVIMLDLKKVYQIKGF